MSDIVQQGRETSRRQELAKNLRDVVSNEAFEVELKDSQFVGSTVRDEQDVHYTLNSKTLQKTEQGAYSLDDVNGTLVSDTNESLNLQSNKAYVNKEEDSLKLYEDVNITTDDYSLHAEQLNVDMKNMSLSSPLPVYGSTNGAKLRADSVYSSENAETITFEGDAYLRLDVSVSAGK